VPVHQRLQQIAEEGSCGVFIQAVQLAERRLDVSKEMHTQLTHELDATPTEKSIAARCGSGTTPPIVLHRRSTTADGDAVGHCSHYGGYSGRHLPRRYRRPLHIRCVHLYNLDDLRRWRKRRRLQRPRIACCVGASWRFKVNRGRHTRSLANMADESQIWKFFHTLRHGRKEVDIV